jgi:hypothetical protein
MAARKEKNDKDGGDDGTPPARRPSQLQLWFEEAWEGWLKPIGLIGLIGVAYLLYKFDLVSEAVAGAALVLLIVIGTIAATALPAWSLARTSAMKALFVTFVAIWAVSVGYPSLRAAIPPRALAEVHLAPGQLSAKAPIDPHHSLELTVSGRFKHVGMQEAEAGYSLTVAGGGASDEVSGSLKRSLVHYRAGRRGGTTSAISEHTENKHRLPTVRGGELSITADAIDEQLDDGLAISVRPGGPNPIIFIVLSVVALLFGIGFDARLQDGKSKVKTYLAAGVGVTLVFAVNFPGDATPHSLVRPAVGAVVLALLIGGLGGWVLGAVAKVLFGPKLKKARR